LRTLDVRIERQGQSALWLAQELEQHSKVVQVLHPGLTSFPGHDLFQRDFKRGSGLFSIVLPEVSRTKLARFVEVLRIFTLGVSWGGFESILYPAHPERTAREWEHPGQVLRISTGLEDPQELLADLRRALDVL
jgi:cystathionine beta-lyase